MICEKCGKEFSQDEKVCPYCSEEEAVLEQTEITEEVANDLEELETPVSKIVRQKRGTARVVIGIVALVLAVAALVVSLLKPVAILGEWKMHQDMPAGMDENGKMMVMQIDSVMKFTTSGELKIAEDLLNYEEVGYTKEQKTIESTFRYSFEKGSLKLEYQPTPEQKKQMEEQGDSSVEPVMMECSVTPGMFSYWQGDQIPRQVYDYYRVGFCHPSMYLWMASAVMLILGVLLVAIPGKKYEVTIREEDAEEAEDLDEFLEDIYEEIEAEDEACVAEETITEEATEVTE